MMSPREFILFDKKRNEAKLYFTLVVELFLHLKLDNLTT